MSISYLFQSVTNNLLGFFFAHSGRALEVADLVTFPNCHVIACPILHNENGLAVRLLGFNLLYQFAAMGITVADNLLQAHVF
jgi:hypothetical protein